MLQITRQSPEQLIVRQNRLSAGRLFRECCIIGLGAALLLVSGPAKLDCQRSEPGQITCQLSYPGWLGIGVWTARSIANLQGVELSQTEDEGVFYDIRLQTSQGEISLRRQPCHGSEVLQSGIQISMEARGG